MGWLLRQHTVSRAISKHALVASSVATLGLLHLFEPQVDIPGLVLVLHFLGLLLVLPDVVLVIDRVTHSRYFAVEAFLDAGFSVVDPHLLQSGAQLKEHATCEMRI